MVDDDTVLVELVVVVSALIVVVVVVLGATVVEVVGATVVVVGRTVEVVEVVAGLRPAVAAGSARGTGPGGGRGHSGEAAALPTGGRGRHLLNRRQRLDVPAGSRSGHEPDQTPTAGAQHHRDDQRRPPSINAEPHQCPRARLRIR